MKTSLAVRIEELINKIDDKQFIQIYNDFLDFKKIHFIEYHLISRISLLSDIEEIIESQAAQRENIYSLARKKVEQEKMNVVIEEKWQQDWIDENKKETSKPVPPMNDFKKVLLYVLGFHFCLISSFMVHSAFFSEKKNEQTKKYEMLEEAYYPEPKKSGPLSDAITFNNKKN